MENRPANTSRERAERFSVMARIRSFRYAFAGMRQFFSSTHNAIVHAIATVAVVLSGLIVKLSATEWLFITMAIGLVWITEFLNTAIEKICNLVSPGYNPMVKFIKDVSAAAVLAAALVAVVTGLIIFIPKLL